MSRLDSADVAERQSALQEEVAKPGTMPLCFGSVVNEACQASEPAIFPLTLAGHINISGTTGSGKSYMARVLIEEASEHEALSILVLDPRNQSAGLLMPEDRLKILDQYGQFGLKSKDARAFKFDYYAPAFASAPPLPADQGKLADGRAIISLKGLDDAQRCRAAFEILDAVFDACAVRESDHPRLLIVVDEAQLLIRKRLDESAKHDASQVERAIDRIAREGRKFGIVLALVSQTMKDFSYDLASIRQMMTTKIFLRNSDREIEYAADVIGDGRLLVQLPTGVALVHNSNWGVIRIRVRPPYSKVFDPGDEHVRRLIDRETGPKAITAEAERLLAEIREHGSSSNSPLNFSRAMKLASITSKRRFLELIGQLERAGAIRTRRLIERGRPRIIDLVNSL